MAEPDRLLIEIARCPIAIGCKTGALPASHPCWPVVDVQRHVPADQHQVPEPWNGDLARAPILFVSSNPSISDVEEYPTWGWSDAEISDFFEKRFGAGRKPWVTEGARSLRADGTRSGSVQFWAGVRNRASELLGRPSVPGEDYALIEIVRCKSKNERGVREARRICPDLYLRRTIEASGASVIVTLGEKARPTVEAIFGGPQRMGVFGPITIGGRERYLASLGHPTGPETKTWEKCVGPQETRRLRDVATAPSAA